MKLLIILLVIALVYFANGYVTVKEKCPKIPIAKNVIRKNEKVSKFANLIYFIFFLVSKNVKT